MGKGRGQKSTLKKSKTNYPMNACDIQCVPRRDPNHRPPDSRCSGDKQVYFYVLTDSVVMWHWQRLLLKDLLFIKASARAGNAGKKSKNSHCLREISHCACTKENSIVNDGRKALLDHVTEVRPPEDI